MHTKKKVDVTQVQTCTSLKYEIRALAWVASSFLVHSVNKLNYSNNNYLLVFNIDLSGLIYWGSASYDVYGFSLF